MLYGSECGRWGAALARSGGISRTAWLDWGAFQTERVECSTGSWLEEPVRNILVDELVTGTRLPQVVELNLQVAGGVTRVAVPRMRLGHGNHKPILAKGRSRWLTIIEGDPVACLALEACVRFPPVADPTSKPDTVSEMTRCKASYMLSAHVFQGRGNRTVYHRTDGGHSAVR